MTFYKIYILILVKHYILDTHVSYLEFFLMSVLFYMENSAVATGLEKVSFHSSLREW